MTAPDDELRRRVAAAYDDVLSEKVPERLTALLEPAPVADLAAARERRARWRPAALSWAQLGGMAASLLLGVIVGMQFAPRSSDSAVALRDGHIVAGAQLAHALDTALASDGAGGPVQVQLSFVDRGGRFCRTFAARQLAGLACREGAQWELVTTARAEAQPAGAMRQAASALPQPVLDAVDARIAGTALDARQERAARDAGWRR